MLIILIAALIVKYPAMLFALIIPLAAIPLKHM